MDRQETFKIEEIKERAKFVERSNELFKGQGQVLMTCSDCLTYVFDTVCEAIIFIIRRVKETEDGIPPHHFKEAYILNIGSPDICIRITTDQESYICKTLESYRYKQETEIARKEQEELDFMLRDSCQRFINNMTEKVMLMKSEFNSSLFSSFDKKDNNNIDPKIVHMLNRYFGVNGWQKYWFTSRQLNRISVEITLNVLLSDNCTTINIPSDKLFSNKMAKLFIKITKER